MIKCAKQLPFLLIFLTLLAPLYGDSEKITLSLWVELEPLVTFDEEEIPLSEEEAMKRILEEARLILSAMIYGYTFTYTPYDKQRQMPESFHLDFLSEIKWGDPYLKVISSEVIDKRLYITIEYRCLEFQTARLKAWQSLAIPAAYGRGTGDFFQGYTEKLTSIENAIKEAIRDYMRKRTFNKPREISGEVIILQNPHIIIKAGEYITTTKVKLNIKEVIPYKIF